MPTTGPTLTDAIAAAETALEHARETVATAHRIASAEAIETQGQRVRIVRNALLRCECLTREAWNVLL